MVSRRSSRKKHCKRRRRTQRGGDTAYFRQNFKANASFDHTAPLNLSDTGKNCIKKALKDNNLGEFSPNMLNENNPAFGTIRKCKEEIRNLQKSTNQRNSIRNEIKIEHKRELKHKIYNLWLCLDKAIDDDNSRANQLSECETMYAEIIPAIRNL
jgi:hypothetical protein